jgi:hypothetical protein
MCANYQEDGMSPEMSPQYESYDGGSNEGGYDSGYGGGDYSCPGGCANGQCYGGGQMPMGMPTAGFAPAATPPNMIAGGPSWGMPITGTPIGLPGPPHIPLGGPAGLQRHVMKNRTRIHMPPPVTQMTMSVKQRPGMNYPRPVNHVSVDEVHRQPGGLFPGISALFHKNAGAGEGGGPPHGYDPNYCP